MDIYPAILVNGFHLRYSSLLHEEANLVKRAARTPEPTNSFVPISGTSNFPSLELNSVFELISPKPNLNHTFKSGPNQIPRSSSKLLTLCGEAPEHFAAKLDSKYSINRDE